MLCPCFKYESSLKKTDMLVGRQATFRHARGKADNIPTCSWEGRQHSDMHVGKQITFRHARAKADNIPTCTWEGRQHSDMLVGRQTTFRHARGKADNIPTCSWESRQHSVAAHAKTREALADDAKVFESICFCFN